MRLSSPATGKRDTLGISLVETLIGLALSVLVLGVSITLATRGGSRSLNLLRLESGAADAHLTAAWLRRDVEGSVAVRMSGDRGTSIRLVKIRAPMTAPSAPLEEVRYDIVEISPSRPDQPRFQVHRQGRFLAGPFRAARFAFLENAAGGCVIRLHLVADGTDKGQSTILRTTVPCPAGGQLPGLERWTTGDEG